MVSLFSLERIATHHVYVGKVLDRKHLREGGSCDQGKGTRKEYDNIRTAQRIPYIIVTVTQLQVSNAES